MANKKNNASSVSDSLMNKFFTGTNKAEEKNEDIVEKEDLKKDDTDTTNSDPIVGTFKIKPKKNKNTKARLNLVITEEQNKKLRRICKETNYNMSELIGELIDQL